MSSFDLIRIGIFILISAGILRFSREALFDPGSYRFYRCLAFEFILAMVLVNIPAWFREPYSGTQLVSWGLLAASAGLALHGFGLLRSMGKPADSIEDTTRLVESGAYRYIRHPLYASLLYFTWGVFFKAPSLLNAGLAGAASLSLYLTAWREERENLERFGEVYRAMMGRTKRFIPFVF
jgi:protein-S-isoprenylcysteine O-methyltransferase Ste14